jgi:hypothetical protein
VDEATTPTAHGTSPLYVESGHDALWHAARRASAALAGHD